MTQPFLSVHVKDSKKEEYKKLRDETLDAINALREGKPVSVSALLRAVFSNHEIVDGNLVIPVSAIFAEVDDA